MTSMKVYRQRLEAERTRLQGDLAHLTSEMADSADQLDPERGGLGNHPADTASDVEEQEKAAGLRVNIEQLLAQVDLAMERVEAGTYGTCANCGKPIPEARLEARPFATLCVDCQQAQEQGRPSSVSTP
jgi:DnaK suppressor protein